MNCETGESSESSNWNFRNELIEGLWKRLARHAHAPISARAFLVAELTHVLACGNQNMNDGGSR